MSIHSTPTLKFNDGAEIPQLGFGVYRIDPAETKAAVSHALGAGYRHVDTAQAYANETGVGEAIRAHGQPVFVTTKYFNPDPDHGYDDAKTAFEASLSRLGLDRIDLYLIHWPMRENELYVDAWKALVDLRASGRAVSVGVSNFLIEHLDRIVDATGVTPAVNQIELHPYFQQTELRRAHASRGIVTEAWGPLANGKVADDPVLGEIGRSHGKSASQVALRWHIQLGNVIFPKATSPDHLRENHEIFDFALSDAEMAAIEGLDRGERTGPDPATYVFPREYRGRAAETKS